MSEAPVTEAPAVATPRPRCSISNHFPPSVRDALVAASLTSSSYDPSAKVKAINRAGAQARATYPELFRKEI